MVASAASAPAKIGVMVESAPADIRRFAPNATNPNVAATNVTRPIWGARPPSRAVAICSGIAIAASVRPAARSRPRSPAVTPHSVRKRGQRLLSAVGVFAIAVETRPWPAPLKPGEQIANVAADCGWNPGGSLTLPPKEARQAEASG